MDIHKHHGLCVKVLFTGPKSEIRMPTSGSWQHLSCTFLAVSMAFSKSLTACCKCLGLAVSTKQTGPTNESNANVGG